MGIKTGRKRKQKGITLVLAASLICTTACGAPEAGNEETQPAVQENTATETEILSEEALVESAEKVPEYVQPEMKGEITVSVYQSEEWLDMAVQMFEEKYPDMTVTVTPFFMGEDSYQVENGGTSLVDRPAGQTKEDYAMWLNTQLISGGAGDLVVTSDGLAVDKYLNMGVFEDLSSYLERTPEFSEDSSDMNINIIDAYRTETGALYQFPISAMACPLLMYQAEVVEDTGTRNQIEGKSLTWQEAVKLAEDIYQNTTLSGVTMPDARTFLGNIFTKEVVDSVNYESGTVQLQEKELNAVLDGFEELKNYNVYTWDPSTIRIFGLDYTADVEAAEYILMNQEYVAAQWKMPDGKVYLSPYFAKDFGMNSRSENKELAWEFLRFLLSDEVQTLPSFPYAGINKNGLKARVDNYCETCGFADRSDEFVELIEGWISAIDGYQAEDTDLIQIGDGILAEYLDGSLKKEEVLSQVQFRLEQYLSE